MSKLCIAALVIGVACSSTIAMAEDENYVFWGDADHDGDIDLQDRPARHLIMAAGFGLPNHPATPTARIKVDVVDSWTTENTIVSVTSSVVVRFFDAATGGNEITLNQNSQLEFSNVTIPSLFLEFDSDGVVLLQYNDGLHPSKFHIFRFSNGIGGPDSLSPHLEVIPGKAWVNLASGNLFFSDTFHRHITPAFRPNIQLSYNSKDGPTGFPIEEAAWRTNYGMEVYEQAYDRDYDEITDRVDGDILVYVDDTGARAIFQYEAATQRYIARDDSRWVGATIDASLSSENDFELVLNRNDNLRHFFFPEYEILGQNFVRCQYRLSKVRSLRDKTIYTNRFSGYDEYDDLWVYFDFNANSTDGYVHQAVGGMLAGWQFEYTPENGLARRYIKKFTLPGLAVYEIEYDEQNRVKTVKLPDPDNPTGPASNTYKRVFTYDGNTTTVTEPFGGNTVYSNINPVLDTWGTITNAEGIATTMALATGKRKPQTITKGQSTQTFAFDSKGNHTSYSISDGPAVTWVYQDFGIPDANLLASTTLSGIGTPTTYEYFITGDQKGLLKKVADRSGEVIEYFYGSVGGDNNPDFLQKVKDKRGKEWIVTSRSTYGQPLTVQAPTFATTGRTLNFTYTAHGLPETGTDVFGFQMSYQYDAQDRLTQVVQPGIGGYSESIFDGLGRLTSTRDFNGNTIEHFYDGLDRLIRSTRKNSGGTKSIGDQTYTYALQPYGMQVTIKQEDINGAFLRDLGILEVDKIGRQKKAWTPRVLNEGGAPTNCWTEFEYLPGEGWLSKTKRQTVGDTTYEYFKSGQLKSVTTPGGAQTFYHYHSAGWLEEVQTPAHASSGLLRNVVNLDNNGRVVRQYLPTSGSLDASVETIFSGGLPTIVRREISGDPVESVTEYDDDGLPTRVTDPFGNRVDLTFTKVGSALEVMKKTYLIDEGGGYPGQPSFQVTETTDSRGFLAQSIHSLTGTTTYSFGNEGMLRDMTLPGGGSFGRTLDALYRTTATSSPFGSTVTQFDALSGDLQYVQSPRGLKSRVTLEPGTGEPRFGWDEKPDSTELYPGEKTFRILARNEAGAAIGVKDAANVTWNITPDYANRQVSAAGPDGVTKLIKYTLSGLPSAAKLGSLPESKTEYNDLGLPTLASDPAGRTVVREFDEWGRPKTVASGGRQVAYTFDNFDRPVTASPSGKGQIKHYYYKFGAHKKTTQRVGGNEKLVVEHKYDSAGRLIKRLYADTVENGDGTLTRGESFTYSSAAGFGRLLTESDRAGRVSKLEYNQTTGQVASRKIYLNQAAYDADPNNPVATITHTYDVDGQLTSASVTGAGLGGSVSRSYDLRGRLASLTHAGGGATLTYRNDNQIATKAYNGKTLAFQYFASGAHEGKLEKVLGGDLGDMTLGYDAFGRNNSTALPNGLARTATFDVSGLPLTMTQAITGQPSESFAYKRDQRGGLLSVTRTVDGGSPEERSWSFDSGGRLIADRRLGTVSTAETFTYSDSDNRTSSTFWSSLAKEEHGFAGPALPPELTVVEGIWEIAGGELVSKVEASETFARANLALAGQSEGVYSTRARINTAGLVANESRFVGLGLTGAAGGRYMAGLEMRSDGGAGFERRLLMVWKPDAGPLEILAADNFTAYTGETLTLNTQVAADTIQAFVTEDAVPALSATLAHGAPSGVGFDTWRNRPPAVGAGPEASPNPVSFGQSGGTPPNLPPGPGPDPLPETVIGYFDNTTGYTHAGTAIVRNYTHNDLNQLTQIGGDEIATLTYNDLGNLTQMVKDGVTTNYAYDILNRLNTHEVAGGTTSSYTYFGPSWMRSTATVGGNTTSYTWDGFACTSQTTNGVSSQYAVPQGLPLWEQTGGTNSVYTHDALGSVAGLWNGTAFTAQYQFNAYGKRTDAGAWPGTHASAAGYRGQLHDIDTADINLRGRQYNPGLGQFTAIDPIGLAGGANLYGYCAGDPVNCWDPTGTDYLKIKDNGDVYYQGTGTSGADWGNAFKIGHTDGTWISLDPAFGGGFAHQATLDHAARDDNRGIARVNIVRGLINDILFDPLASNTPMLDRGIGAAKAGLELPRIIKDTTFAVGHMAITGEQATSRDFARNVGSSDEVFGTSMLYSAVGQQLDSGKSRSTVILGTWENKGTDSLLGNMLVRTNPVTGLGFAVADISIGEASGDYERAGGGYLVLGTLPLAKAVHTVKTGGFGALRAQLTEAPRLNYIVQEGTHSIRTYMLRQITEGAVRDVDAAIAANDRATLIRYGAGPNEALRILAGQDNGRFRGTVINMLAQARASSRLGLRSLNYTPRFAYGPDVWNTVTRRSWDWTTTRQFEAHEIQYVTDPPTNRPSWFSIEHLNTDR